MFYSKDEVTNINADFEYSKTFKSFRYKTRLVGQADATNRILENAANAAPSEYLTKFWRPLELSLINCKVELKLQ